MLITFIRTVLLFFIVMIVLRLLGKRQIGELQSYDLVITIMISDLALMPMQDTRLPMLLGIVPIITLLVLKTLVAQIQLKSQFARKILDGQPAILIYKSKINYSTLKSQQINIDELMEALRLEGYFDLEEIHYAILETNGKISILPKSQNILEHNSLNIKNPNNNGKNTDCNSYDKLCKHTKRDLGYDDSKIISKTLSGREIEGEIFLPKVVISDGEININLLNKINKDKKWIEDKLKEYDVNSIDKVLIALFDTQGNFKFQLYDEIISKGKDNK